MPKLPPQIRELDEFSESINMVVYGNSGVGKTVFAATAPNALILGVESGTISAKRSGRSNAKVWNIETWDDLEAAYEWLYENPDHGFEWVVIDSATAMQRLAFKAVLEAGVETNPSRDPDTPQLQDYGKYQNMFKRFVEAFNQLPVNVCWTALAMTRENQDDKPETLPFFINTPKNPISEWFCGELHLVAYLGMATDRETKLKVRKLLFQSQPPYVAKDRYDALGTSKTVSKGSEQLFEMKDLIAAIEGSGTMEKPERENRPKAAHTKITPADDLSVDGLDDTNTNTTTK